MFDSLEYRKSIIAEIKSQENKDRKAKSLQEYEIYNGNINQYVEAYLTQQLSAKTVKKMPIISSIDICKRIVDQEASVYKSEPKREFVDIQEADKEALELVYEDAMADLKLMKSNRYYKLQAQSLIQVLPKEGKLDFRILMPHHYDVVPDPEDPEKAQAIIISAFDKEVYSEGTRYNNNSNFVTGNSSDNMNQTLADKEDYKASLERYAVWTLEYNFIMNGNGVITSGPDITNPIGVMPFVEAVADKDFTYFVDRGSQLANFAVQYNAALSDLANIVRLQAYSQAVMIGAKESMPEEITVGPTTVIKMTVDTNNPTPTDFKFVSPSPDLGGSIQFIEVLISNFLSSRGLSPATVSGKAEGDRFTSGVDRFLSMIDRFEATKQDYSIYKSIEQKLFNVIKAWLLRYTNTQFLDKKYWVSQSVDNSYLNITFQKPDEAQSQKEKLDIIQQKLELGLMDDVSAVMQLDGLSELEAQDKLKKIKDRSNELAENDVEDQQLETNTVGSESNNRP
jgi:hypothetical protein